MTTRSVITLGILRGIDCLRSRSDRAAVTIQLYLDNRTPVRNSANRTRCNGIFTDSDIPCGTVAYREESRLSEHVNYTPAQCNILSLMETLN